MEETGSEESADGSVAVVACYCGDRDGGEVDRRGGGGFVRPLEGGYWRNGGSPAWRSFESVNVRGS